MHKYPNDWNNNKYFPFGKYIELYSDQVILQTSIMKCLKKGPINHALLPFSIISYFWDCLIRDHFCENAKENLSTYSSPGGIVVYIINNRYKKIKKDSYTYLVVIVAKEKLHLKKFVQKGKTGI